MSDEVTQYKSKVLGKINSTYEAASHSTFKMAAPAPGPTAVLPDVKIKVERAYGTPKIYFLDGKETHMVYATEFEAGKIYEFELSEYACEDEYHAMGIAGPLDSIPTKPYGTQYAKEFLSPFYSFKSKCVSQLDLTYAKADTTLWVYCMNHLSPYGQLRVVAPGVEKVPMTVFRPYGTPKSYFFDGKQTSMEDGITLEAGKSYEFSLSEYACFDEYHSLGVAGPLDYVPKKPVTEKLYDVGFLSPYYFYTAKCKSTLDLTYAKKDIVLYVWCMNHKSVYTTILVK